MSPGNTNYTGRGSEPFLRGKAVLAVMAATLTLVGCRIEIIVPAGGRVVTQSGQYECQPGETCVIDIVDLFFNEEYIAQPDSGYTFLQWKKRGGHAAFAVAKRKAALLTHRLQSVMKN